MNIVLAGIIFSLLSCSFSLARAEAVPLSFRQFTEKVMAYYPKLKAAHSDVDMALAKQMQAKAGFWPSLDISAGYKISDDPVNVFGMLLHQERFTSADFDLKRLNTPERHQDLSAGVHAEWPLFDAMQTIGRVRSAQAGLKASKEDESFSQMEALLMAQDVYWNAMTLEKLSSVMDEVKKNSDEDIQKARDLKDKGMILGADYYSARVMAGDFERTRNEIARQKTAMMALLNILMGEPWDRPWTLGDVLKDADAPLLDQQQLLDAAFAGRSDMASMQARLQALDFELSREQSTMWPRLSAFGDASHDTNKIGASGGNNYTVGVKADVSVFDPSRASRIREIQYRKEQMEHQKDLLKNSIERDLVEEISRYNALRDNMPVLKSMTDDAKEAVALVVPLYSEGRKSIADLLDMRRVYWQTSQAYLKALSGIWLSHARLLFLSGQLNEKTIMALSEGAKR